MLWAQFGCNVKFQFILFFQNSTVCFPHLCIWIQTIWIIISTFIPHNPCARQIGAIILHSCHLLCLLLNFSCSCHVQDGTSSLFPVQVMRWSTASPPVPNNDVIIKDWTTYVSLNFWIHGSESTPWHKLFNSPPSQQLSMSQEYLFWWTSAVAFHALW